MKVWLNRSLAWPLFVLSAGLLFFQGGVGAFVWQMFRRVPRYLGNGPFLWSVFGAEFLVDIFLVAWVAQAINRRRDHSRPAVLFFLWQGVKVTFSFFYVASTFGHFPFPHWI